MKEKKKLNKKNIILIILCLLIILAIGIIIYLLILNNNNNNNNNSSTKFNNNLYEETEIENIKIKIEKIKYEDNYSDILLDISNNSNDDIDINDLKIIFKDDDNNTIAELFSYDNGILKIGESKTLSLSIDKDIANSTKVTYELIKENNNEE
ncbi:MAG: hypothetical protein ACI31S_00060 [Bacilli bacterium]